MQNTAVYAPIKIEEIVMVMIRSEIIHVISKSNMCTLHSVQLPIYYIHLGTFLLEQSCKICHTTASFAFHFPEISLVTLNKP